jgi:peptidoglycan/LPS O-acetylase OafA/YrhL
MIAWHHFVSYPPLAVWAMPVAGELIHWFRHYGRGTQIFFVVSGYVMARSMSRETWNIPRACRFVVRRYCRLGLPYLAAIVLAMGACALARGSIDEEVVGPPPTWDQLLTHLVFAQYILGYDSLSAGMWFVCINFQLGLIYVAALLLRDWIASRSGQSARDRWEKLPMALGWLLAGASLFYFNLDQRWDNWALYFFGQFFFGVVVHRALHKPGGQVLFGIYAMMLVAAMTLHWRGRLLTTLVTGLVLLIGGKTGFNSRWFNNPIMSFLGRTSYSLFLVHFPVLVVVATIWARAEWVSPEAAMIALVVAYLASLGVAALFYRAVELPAARLSQGLRPALATAPPPSVLAHREA